MITDDELAYLETCDLVNNDGARKLVEEVRRLRALLETADREQFSTNVEVDNLRKMLADWQRAHSDPNEVPRPMCKPDPCDGIFPPTKDERREA